MMRMFWVCAMALMVPVLAQGQPAPGGWMPDLTQQQTYTWHHASSQDRSGGNHDWVTVAPGATETVLDADGPGMVSHVWFTISDGETYHLKKIVLRMYWDGETSPSVEAPIGDFYGLGLGVYRNWHSELLSVGSKQALNCFFPMPFQKHARITVTNEGKEPIGSLYYNIDYRTYDHALPAGTLYFHAEYRQGQPNKGWRTQWTEDAAEKKNLDGKDNYVWFEATGHGQFVGVTMSVLQNQNGWWGEGDPMFFIDDASMPYQPGGTGSEDYFLGAWDFGGQPFDYPLYGAPVVGDELAGGRWSVYRFHLDSPIPFKKSMKATIEHGHANDRSDNYSSVAYWYQAEPHQEFPALPSVEERLPAIQMVGGPGNGGAARP